MIETNKNMLKLKQIMANIQKHVSLDTIAIILSSLAHLLFPIAFIYPNQHKFHPIVNNLQRGIAIVISHIIICKFFGISLDFPSGSDLKYLSIRNGIMLIHSLMYAAMYFVIAYPILNSIFLVGPLSVFVVDYYLNGVQITKFQVYGISIGMLGVLLVINADILLGFFTQVNKNYTKYQNYIVQDPLIKVMLSFVFLFMSFVWGYAITIQKKIKNQPGIKISYFLGLILTFSSGIIYSFGNIQPIEPQIFLKSMFFSGFIISATQIMFISALRLTKYSGKMSILMLLYEIPSYLISVFRYGEPLNVISIFGVIIMSFGLYKCVFNR